MSPTRLTAALLLVLLVPDSTRAQAAPTDLAGDPLPPGAIARIGTTRYRVRGWHQQVFFSRDGNTVLAKGEQSVIKFWDATTGKSTGEFKEPDLFNWNADQSPDGKFLAVFGTVKSEKPPYRPGLRLYDLTTRKALWTANPADIDRADNTKVLFTPDGKRLITAGGDVRVWDAKTGTELLRQKVPVGYGSLDVSPDGKTIAVGYYELYVWDWESGAAPRKVEAGLRSGLQGLRFSPDGRTLYVMGDVGSARGFDVATGKPAGRLEVGSAARWVTFSPDGNTYAVGHFNTSARREASVSLREAATGKEVASLRCGTDVADHGRWSRDGNRFAAVTDHRVWVWDVKTGKPFGPDVPGHEAAITEMVFAPDGRLYTASDDHTVRAWDPATGKELLKLPMDGWVRGMAISPDGGLVAGNGLRNDFRVWDAKTGRQVFKLRGHGEMGGFRKVRFSADEQTLLSYGDDFYLRVWDTLTGKLKAEHRFLPRGRVGGADPDDDRFERDLMMFGEREADMGPDGNTLVRAVGKDVSVVAADTGKERFKFEADPQSVHKLALSPDGKRLATSGPGVVPPKLKPGEMPARPNDYQVTVWDLRDATAVAKFRVAGSDFAGLLQFTPDGRSVVTSSSEAVLRFWDAKTGAAIGTVEFPDKVARVAFDGGMKRVAVSFWDTTAVVYDLAAVLKPAKKE